MRTFDDFQILSNAKKERTVNTVECLAKCYRERVEITLNGLKMKAKLFFSLINSTNAFAGCNLMVIFRLESRSVNVTGIIS